MAIITILNNDYARLRDIEWDFAEVLQEPPSKLHPYPARFIESIPRTLIDVLGCNYNGVVFDPFCGSGTTLYEAQRLGFNSIGVDSNPVACLISRVKTRNLPSLFNQVSEIVHSKALQAYSPRYIVPNIPNLNHWFKKEVQVAISTIISEITRQDDDVTRDALKLALSSIVVRVSNQDSDTRYASVEKSVTYEDVYNFFLNACHKLIENKPTLASNARATIIHKDILDTSKADINEPISLVITSPPYPNAYEYWLYHKYRMWWLGYDPIKVRTHEIGSRPHYQKKNGQTEKDFANQLNQVFSLFNTIVMQGGYVCIVIGRSIIKGRTINNAEIISNLAKQHEYSSIAIIDRSISATRKSFNLKYGKINSENILIYRKEK